MMIKKILPAAYLMACLLCSCSTGNADGQPTSQATYSDEAEIKKNLDAYVEAFNRKDAEKLASFWAEDAEFYNPLTGEEFEGRNEIESYFKRKFDSDRDQQLKITVDKIDFPASDEADVKLHFEMLSKNEAPISGKLQMEYEKDDSKWYIVNLSEFEKLQSNTNYEKLKDFNWLVGKWEDESNDDNIEVVSEWKWDVHKNFLTERFFIKILGEDDFDGFQILGWDAAKEKVRLWVFDSDGGFGDGVLNAQSDSWYAPMVFTLSDGTTGTTTNIYKKIDDQSYTFSSIDRDIDGNMLPNVGPFKMVKK